MWNAHLLSLEHTLTIPTSGPLHMPILLPGEFIPAQMAPHFSGFTKMSLSLTTPTLVGAETPVALGCRVLLFPTLPNSEHPHTIALG